jgi:hypothetical protein
LTEANAGELTAASAEAARPVPVPVPAEVPYCRNCGAPLAGAFCSDCGQSGDVHVPTTHELIHETLEGITHSDSRLWVTLNYLLFMPGKLTNEFIAGRRVSYLPPIRLYLVLSVMFFLLVPAPNADLGGEEPVQIGVGGHEVGAPASSASTGEAASAKPASDSGLRKLPPSERCKSMESDISASTEAFLRNACERVLADNGKSFEHNIAATFPKAMFIFLPLIAFFNMLMYWWPRQRYAVHLLFFVHVHAFAFLAFTLMWLLGAIGAWLPAVRGTLQVLQAAIGLWVPFYILKALRRVFGRGRWNTLVKATALFFIYVTVFGVTFLGVVLYAAWRA